MTMTRDKMRELQSFKPQKRYFTINRQGLVDRAVSQIILMVKAGEGTVDGVSHKFLAPLTRDELKEARETAKVRLSQRVSA